MGYGYLGHIVAGVESVSLRVNSAELTHVVLDKLFPLRLDEIQTFFLHKGGHVKATVQPWVKTGKKEGGERKRGRSGGGGGVGGRKRGGRGERKKGRREGRGRGGRREGRGGGKEGGKRKRGRKEGKGKWKRE